MKPKLTKEQIREFEIKELKQKMETGTIELDRYINTIVKYAFTDCCTSGVYYEGLYHDMFKLGVDEVDNSNKSEKEKDALKYELCPIFCRRDEVEQLKSEVKYIEGKIGWAKSMLSMLNDDQKEKIIRNCLTQEYLWSSQFSRNSSVRKQLEAKSKPAVKK